MSNILPVVCTTCPCPMRYPRKNTRGRHKSKSEGMFTIKYDQVDQKTGPAFGSENLVLVRVPPSEQKCALRVNISPISIDANWAMI